MIRERFEPAGFFVLRTPLLPVDEIRAWTRAAAAGGGARFVEERTGRPGIREALYVASPGLLERMDAARRKAGGRDRGLERAVARYLARMAGRSTPFGLFAGTTVGRIADRDALRLPPRAHYERDTRLDMDYLTRLVAALQETGGVRGRDRHVPNTSLYRAGGKLRYAEGRMTEQGRRYFLVSVQEDEALARALERARRGATRAEVARAVRVDGVGEDEARAFVDELVQAQVLVSELEPPVTGPEPLRALRESLTALSGRNGSGVAPEVVTDGSHAPGSVASALRTLEEVTDGLRALDAAGVGNDPAFYRELGSRLADLPARPDPARLFQVDLRKPAPGITLSRRHADALLDAVQVLHHLFAPAEDGLEPFRRAFQERYGDREVPLAVVLDEERGIGFGASPTGAGDPAPLLDGLPIGPAGGDQQVRWSGATTVLLRRLTGALAAGEPEIRIEPAEAEELRDPRALPLPDAFQVVATVIGPGPEGGEPRLVLSGAGGPSGARMLGRFCHADAELCRLTAEHLRAEEALRPDAVFAEIVHLPEGRIGNVLARPLLRGHEIPFLGRSGTTAERRIPLEDLHVRVRNERVLLRSARLDREVLPRLTTAHDYTRSLGTYRFLGALQSQGCCGALGFRWAPLAAAPFLPRVRIGRVIVARARWNLGRQHLDGVLAAGEAAAPARFRELAHERGLPRWFGLVEGDNVLPVDLENDALLGVLLDLVRRRPAVTLEELFLAEEDLVVEGPEGRFTHELVIPFQRKRGNVGNGEAAGRSLLVHSAAAGFPTTFPPGSDWLYFKAYGGPAGGDELLRGGFGDLAEQLVRDGLASGWFFVRYADPEPHLRLRFAGERAKLDALVQPVIRDALHAWLATGAGWRLQLDTYEREVHRYGGPEGIVLCERLFHADSHAVSRLLSLTAGDDGAADRWKLAAAGMDHLLSDLGFDDLGKWALLRGLAAGFARELRVEGDLRRALMDRFRRERSGLMALLDPAAAQDGSLPERQRAGLQLLAERSRRSAAPAGGLRFLAAAHRLERPLPAITGALLHMHANRMFRSSARAQEAVLCHFLERIHDARLARAGIRSRDRMALLRERSLPTPAGEGA